MRSHQEKPIATEGQPPRREIQGPRPAPLQICRPSHRIRKPTLPTAGDRVQPVIIYTHSPKIIHTEAQNFMTLVQRLTGSPDTRSRSKKPKRRSAVDPPMPAASSTSLEPSESTADRSSEAGNNMDRSRPNNPPDDLCDRSGEDDSDLPATSDLSIHRVQPASYATSSSVSAADNSSSAMNRTSQYPIVGSTSTISAISGGPIPPTSPSSLLPSPNYGLLSPSILQDLPLFTPNSDNFFYSPRHFYRFSEPMFTPPQKSPPSSLISPSPSALDLFKTLPEY